MRPSLIAASLVAGTALLGFRAHTGAQEPPQPSPAMNGIAHVAIRVQDLSRSRAFYHDLGFEEAFAFDKDGIPTEVFFKVNDTQFLELYPKRDADETNGFLHICFESKDLEPLNRYYESHNLHPTEVKKAGAGNLLFTMSGPEDQNIEFTQYMPGSRHTLDIGKHLGKGRIADEILGVGIQMQQVETAARFYAEQMGFVRTGQQDHAKVFLIPGHNRQEIEIVPKTDRNQPLMILAAKSWKQASGQLKLRGIAFDRHKSTLQLRDPDGNVLQLRWAPRAARSSKN